MIKRLKAIFDGKAFRPVEPLDLEPNTVVELTLELPERDADSTQSFLDVAEGLELDGPSDWSSSVDAYLYGFPPEQSNG